MRSLAVYRPQLAIEAEQPLHVKGQDLQRRRAILWSPLLGAVGGAAAMLLLVVAYLHLASAAPSLATPTVQSVNGQSRVEVTSVASVIVTATPAPVSVTASQLYIAKMAEAQMTAMAGAQTQPLSTGSPSTPMVIAPTAMPIPSTSTPIPSTVVPVPKAGTIVYQADWTKGRAGWDLSGGWKFLDGEAFNDASNSAVSGGEFSPAPYQLGDLLDYAVEVDAQVLRSSTYSCFPAFGIVVRGGYLGGPEGTCGSGGTRLIIGFGNTQSVGSSLAFESYLSTEDFPLGSDWHHYRFEARANQLTLTIDSRVVVKAADNRLLSPGRIGLWSRDMQVAVRSFKVIALGEVSS